MQQKLSAFDKLVCVKMTIYKEKSAGLRLHYRRMAMGDLPLLMGLSSLEGYDKGGQFRLQLRSSTKYTIFSFEGAACVVPTDGHGRRVEAGWYRVNLRYSYAAILPSFVSGPSQYLPLGEMKIALTNDRLLAAIGTKRPPPGSGEPLSGQATVFLRGPRVHTYKTEFRYSKADVLQWLAAQTLDAALKSQWIDIAPALVLHLNRIARRSGKADLAGLLRELMDLYLVQPGQRAKPMHLAMILQRQRYPYQRGAAAESQ